MRANTLLAAAFAAVAVAGGGCGSGGGGGDVPPASAAYVPMSAPRNVGGIQFSQYADRATYKGNELIHITFLVTNNPPNTEPQRAVAYIVQLPPYFVGEATDTHGHSVALEYPYQAAAGGTDVVGFFTDLIQPTQVTGFVQTTGLPPGIWTISSWLRYDITGTFKAGVFPAGSEQTTEYANPITVTVLP